MPASSVATPLVGAGAFAVLLLSIGLLVVVFRSAGARRAHLVASDEHLYRPAPRALPPVAAGPAEPGTGQELVPRRPPRRERPLPAEVVIGCAWSDAVFAGVCGRADGVRLVVRGAALRGGLHATTESEGQDVVGARWNRDAGALYVVVADGLGSLPNSAAVADEAVRAALFMTASKPDELSFARAGAQLFQRIARGLTRRGRGDSNDGGTTLVVAEVKPHPAGVVVNVHGVGDSEAWVLGRHGWRPLHREWSDVDDNATRDVTIDPAPQGASDRLQRGDVLLLATDGLARSLHDGEWSTLWRTPPPAAEFLRSLTTVDDFSDDRGVVAVWIE